MSKATFVAIPPQLARSEQRHMADIVDTIRESLVGYLMKHLSKVLRVQL
jgi:hypothetical protein